MTEAVTPSIDALVSAFESGKPVVDLLAELNRNTEDALLAHIGYEEMAELNCINVSHQRDIFMTDDDITEVYEKEYLLGLNDQQILAFIAERQGDLEEEDGGTVLHYLPISSSCISFLSKSGGQGGPIFSNLIIGRTEQDVTAQLVEDDFRIHTVDLSASERAVLVQEFNMLVRARLSGKLEKFVNFIKFLRRK